MKNLQNYLVETILTEAKVDTVDATVDTLLGNCNIDVKKEDLANAINTVMGMGYKSVSETPYGDGYNHSFYIFSKGKSSDMILVSCCARGRHDKDAIVLTYTTNRSSISTSDGEIIIRAADGYQKSRNVHLNGQEMVNIWIQETDFGELNGIIKKATWYTKAKYWMKSSMSGSEIYSSRSFFI